MGRVNQHHSSCRRARRSWASCCRAARSCSARRCSALGGLVSQRAAGRRPHPLGGRALGGGRQPRRRDAPGRRRHPDPRPPGQLTDLGNEIHPKAIAGVHHEPGAVETDALALFHDPLIGFDALEPAFLAELEARSLLRGGQFLDLTFAKRIEVHEGRPRGQQPVGARVGGGRWRFRSRRSWRRRRSPTPPSTPPPATR